MSSASSTSSPPPRAGRHLEGNETSHTGSLRAGGTGRRSGRRGARRRRRPPCPRAVPGNVAADRRRGLERPTRAAETPASGRAAGSEGHGPRGYGRRTRAPTSRHRRAAVGASSICRAKVGRSMRPANRSTVGARSSVPGGSSPGSPAALGDGRHQLGSRDRVAPEREEVVVAAPTGSRRADRPRARRPPALARCSARRTGAREHRSRVSPVR